MAARMLVWPVPMRTGTPVIHRLDGERGEVLALGLGHLGELPARAQEEQPVDALPDEHVDQRLHAGPVDCSIRGEEG